MNKRIHANHCLKFSLKSGRITTSSMCNALLQKRKLYSLLPCLFLPHVHVVPTPQQGQLHIYITILFNAALTLMYRQTENVYPFIVTLIVDINQLSNSITSLNHASDSNFVVSRCICQLFK
jgi:hypothetical protein